MASAEFDPQTVIVGCTAEIERIKDWREKQRQDYIERCMCEPRVRGPFWRKEAYCMTRDEAIKDYERTREWSDSPSDRHDRTARNWTGEMNDILALARKATVEKSKVLLSDGEVKSIWPNL